MTRQALSLSMIYMLMSFTACGVAAPAQQTTHSQQQLMGMIDRYFAGTASEEDYAYLSELTVRLEADPVLAPVMNDLTSRIQGATDEATIGAVLKSRWATIPRDEATRQRVGQYVDKAQQVSRDVTNSAPGVNRSAALFAYIIAGFVALYLLELDQCYQCGITGADTAYCNWCS